MARLALIALLAGAGALSACYPISRRAYDATSVSGLAVNPANPDDVTALHAGRIERSLDGGLTWNVQPAFAQLTAIAASGSTIYGVERDDASPSPALAIWRSDDLGSSFVRVGSVPAPYSTARVALAAIDSRHAILAIEGPDRVVLTSTDAGQSWGAASVSSGSSSQGSFLPYVVAADRARSHVIFIGHATGLLRSTDGGLSFADVAAPTSAADVRDIAAMGSSVFAATSSGLGVSTDEGATWTLRTVGVGGTVENVALDATVSPPRLYATIGRGGLHVSTDGGQTFTLVLPGRRGPIIARGPVIYLHGTRSIDSGATFRDFAPFDFVALVITYI